MAQLQRTKIERSQHFQFLANESRTLNVAALAYVLNRDEVSTCIPGAKSVEQLRSNVSASEARLTNDDLTKIAEIQQKWLQS